MRGLAVLLVAGLLWLPVGQVVVSPTLSTLGGQPLDTDLTAIAALTSAADKCPYATGAGTWALADCTAAARTVLDDATVGDMVTTIGGAAASGTGGLARVISPTFTTSARVEGANTQRATWQQATVAVTCNSGGATCTATNLIPAGSLVIGVDARVTTILAGVGLTTWKIGDGSDDDRWGATLALAAGTTVTLANATITSVPIYAAATSVVLTAAAGQFDSGVVRITVHYISLTAAAS